MAGRAADRKSRPGPWSGELAPGRCRRRLGAPVRCSWPSAISRSSRPRSSGRCSTPRRCAAARSSSRSTRTSAGATRSCCTVRPSASRRGHRRSGSRAGAGRPPRARRRGPGRRHNPDVDTPADLARAIEASWAARVRANREQVERVREIPDGADFYAPVQSLFRADPTRTDDPILDALLDLVRSGEVWLDVGAGAGRFALPIARALDPSGGSVVALDLIGFDARRPARDRRGLRDRERPHRRGSLAADGCAGRCGSRGGCRADRPRRLRHRGPSGRSSMRSKLPPDACVWRSSWSGYPRQPRTRSGHRSTGKPGWPCRPCPTSWSYWKLAARRPSVTRIAIDPRRFNSRDALEGFLRRQMWIDPEGKKEKRFRGRSTT